MNCFCVETKLGVFAFESKLDATNFMLDIKCGRLPMEEVGYEDTKYYGGCYSRGTVSDAVKEYLRRNEILMKEFEWLQYRFTH